LLLLLISLFISSAGSAETVSSPSLSPSGMPSRAHSYPPSVFAAILSTLGFQEFSSAAAASHNFSATPVTIFAPTDASLISCRSCSVPVLLQELSLPGIYDLRYLRSLIFGTKIETLAPDRCLTITTGDKDKVFVNGIEITSPDLFNNGLVVVHGLQGFVSHLSPLSCNVEHMTSLVFPSAHSASSASASITRLMLKDAIIRLQASGYSIVSLALRVKYLELADLRSMTIFALDDFSIFSGGGSFYLSNFRYHVVPNKRLTAKELVSLPIDSSLLTLDVGNRLAITTGGGQGPLSPMRINYVKISTIDVLHNTRIAVHGISSPFPHLHQHHYQAHDNAEDGYGQTQHSNCDHSDWTRGICVAEAETPAGLDPTVDVEGHKGL
ncbi:hypothetical protein M569_15852, partial [Genlisea aurea]